MSATIVIGLVPNEGGKSEQVAASTVSAQSTVLYPTPQSAGYVNVYCASDYFFKAGVNPTALATGVDQFVPGGNLLRVGPIAPGFRLAFILLTGTATVYITEEN